MIHEADTTLSVKEVLDRANAFFSERVPHYGAYPEKRGDTFVVFRGQGGEEIVIAAFPGENGTRIRASTLLYDQAIDRFLSTLPGPTGAEAA